MSSALESEGTEEADVLSLVKFDESDQYQKPLGCPPQYQEALSTHAKELLRVIRTMLPLAFYLRDMEHCRRYLLQLKSYLSYKYPLPTYVRMELISKLWGFFTDHTHRPKHLHCQSLIAALLTQLLKKKDLDKWAHENGHPPFTLPWRPLYDILRDVHLVRTPFFEGMDHHARDLVSLIAKARRYFPAGSAKEIYDAFVPMLCSQEHMYFRAQSLLSLFMPHSGPADCQVITERLFQCGQWVDRCPTSLGCWLYLWARFAKASVGTFHLTGEQQAILFNTFLQNLRLQVGGSLGGGTRSWPSEGWLLGRCADPNSVTRDMAKLVIWTLHLPHTMPNLTQLFSSVKTYFHPSNLGHWTKMLSSFLRELGRYYAKRHSAERRDKVSHGAQYRLDLSDTTLAKALQELAMMALFSKAPNMVSVGSETLLHLAYIFPEVILPPLLEQIYPALQDVRHSHRTMSVLQCLASLGRPLLHRVNYPAGAAHLRQLLWLSLPGIDPTDVAKSGRTLSWLTNVFYIIPFMAPQDTKRQDDQEEMGDEESTAQDTVIELAEWAAAFLDKLSEVVKHMDAYSKHNKVDQASATVLFKALKAFFSCLSDTTYAASLTHVKRLVTSRQDVEVKKWYGQLVEAACMPKPAISLPAIFTPLANKIVQGDQLTTASKSELEWYLYLLSQSVQRAGGAHQELMAYADKVWTIYRLTRDHKDKQVRKNAGKLLRKFLKALTLDYPLDERPHSPQHWAQPTDWKHWQSWGTYTGSRDLGKEEKGKRTRALHHSEVEVVWHVPCEAELACAADLVNKALEAPLATLSNLQQLLSHSEILEENGSEAASHESSPVEKVERALQMVLTVARGAEAVLGPLQGAEKQWGKEPDSTRDEDWEPATTIDWESFALASASRCPMVVPGFPQLLRPLRAPPGQHSDAKLLPDESLRTFLVAFLEKVCKTLLLSTAPRRTKSLSLVGKLIAVILTGYGYSDQYVYKLWLWNKYARRAVSEEWSGLRGNTRPLLVQRAHAVHITRLQRQAHAQVYTEKAAALINQLAQLAVSEFPKVRKVAIERLGHVLSVMPRSFNPVLAMLLSVLTHSAPISSASSSSTHTPENKTRTLSSNSPAKTGPEISPTQIQKLQGALHVLATSNFPASIARKISRLDQSIRSLLACEPHTDDTVQLMVHELFLAIYSNLNHCLHVAIDELQPDTLVALDHPWKSWLTSKAINQRNRSIRSHRSRVLGQLVCLLHTLQQHAQPEQINPTKAVSPVKARHWRYRLMSAGFLFTLLSPNIRLDIGRAVVGAKPKATALQLAVEPWRKWKCKDVARWLREQGLGQHAQVFEEAGVVGDDLDLIGDAQLQEDFEVKEPEARAAILAKLGRLVGGPTGEEVYQETVLLFAKCLCRFEALSSLRKQALVALMHALDLHYLAPRLSGASPKHALYVSDVSEFDLQPLSSAQQAVQPLTAHDWATAGPAKLYPFHGWFDQNTLHYLQCSPAKASSEAWQAHGERSALPLLFNKPLPPSTLAALRSLLVNRPAVDALVQTFVLNHPSLAHDQLGEGVGRHRGAQKPIGLGEELGRLFYVFEHKTNFTRFPTESTAVDALHVRLVTQLCRLFPELLSEDLLLGAARKLVASQGEAEDQCTAAELIAGMVCVVTGDDLPVAACLATQQALAPLIKSALEDCPPDSRSYWSHGLRLCFSNANPRRLAWMGQGVVQAAFGKLPGKDKTDSSALLEVALTLSDTPSLHVKRLRFLQSYLLECGWRLPGLATWVLEQVEQPQLMANPYKAVREEVGRTLFIVARSLFRVTPSQQEGPLKELTHQQLFQDVLLSFARRCASKMDEILSKEVEEKRGGTEQKDDQGHLFLETVLYWLLGLLNGTDSAVCVPVCLLLLPGVLRTQRNKDQLTAATAQLVASLCAGISLPPALLPQAIAQGKSVCQDTFWSTRVAGLAFFKALAPKHSHLLTAAQAEELLALTLTSLQDPQLEVRIEARDLLSSLLASLPNAQQQDKAVVVVTVQQGGFALNISCLQRKFIKLAKTKLPGGEAREGEREGKGRKLKKAKKDPEPSSEPDSTAASSKNVRKICKRHAGVLGLSAMVMQHPYELPSHMPTVLAYLSSHVKDPMPISGGICELFASWRKTHKDMWHVFKNQFSENELELVNSVAMNASYFA
eukprot:g46569.t1